MLFVESEPVKTPLRSRPPTVDGPRIVPVGLAALSLIGGVAGFLSDGVRTAAAERVTPPFEEQGSIHNTPLMPMQASPLPRSLPELVAGGWRVVGMTLSGRIFQYHLVGEESLAICFVDTQGTAPASECIRLASVPR